MGKSKLNKEEQSAERRATAEDARVALVGQYLQLGVTMKKTASAIEAYAHALNDADGTGEVIALLRRGPEGLVPGLPMAFPFLDTYPPVSKGADSDDAVKKSKKRPAQAALSGENESEDELATPGAVNGKKKRAKKEKDPNAPKRPMSAYLIFQNSVRDETKQKHPDMPYKEIINIVGSHWKALDEDGQRPYKEAADTAMAQWKEANAAYLAEKGGDATLLAADDEEDAEVEEAVVSKKSKKEKKEKPEKEKKDKSLDKRTKEGKAAAALAAAGTGSDVKPASSSTKPVSSSKKDSKPIATSTPAPSKTAPKAVVPPTSTKKNVPQTAAESSSSSSSSSESDSESSESESE